ncbi:MAG TPA: prolipoprotein diacylglyceryl transferase [Firmicutes bacterium]|nr:prolipoprotein diacylglyceryl transferase [Bacillota bacterium]
MYPVLLEFGGFSLYAYGATLALAFIVGIIWMLKEAPGKGFNTDYLYEAYIISIFLAIAGSRIAYVMLNWELYQDAPLWRTLFAWRGGLSFHGGLIAVLLGLLLHCYYRRVSFLKLMDFGAPFIALGYAITRVGCFLNGCCYGNVTAGPWGLVFPLIDGLPRHPTQLYAVFAGLVIFMLLRYLRRYSFFDGYIFILFLIFNGVYRFVVEFFRVNEPAWWLLSQAQLISLFMIAVALIFFAWKFRKHNFPKMR